MMKLTTVLLVLAAFAGRVPAGDWTEPVEVRHELRRCIFYRARLAGEFLIVQANPEAGWHTFAMDNQQRAKEKLEGKPSLGGDLPTEIKVSHGLEAVGPWYQSPPKDFSKPELQWFSWGFDGQALFVAKVRHSGAGRARIAVQGQACTDTTCKQVNVAISLALGSAGPGRDRADLDWNALVRVRPLR